MKRSLVLCLTALILLSGCRRDASGSYIAHYEDGLCWLQLVRTPDNHLTGQMVVSLLKPDGRVDRQSITLNGAIEGDNITLTGGGFLGMGVTALSGTLERKSRIPFVTATDKDSRYY